MNLRVGILAFFLVPTLLSAESIMYITPEEDAFSIGETFQVSVWVDADESINAAEGELTFDPSVLKATAISSAGSFLKQWPTVPSYSNSDGAVRFSGWGQFQGTEGRVITVTFQTIRPGQGSVQLSAGAALATGQGSNVITTLRSGTYTVGNIPEQTEVVFADTPEGESVTSSETEATTTETLPTTEGTAGIPSTSPMLERVLITSYEETIEDGTRSIIRGTATPLSRVWVWTEHATDKPVRSEIMSDKDGAFTFRSRQLQTGVYRFRAEVHGNAVTIKPSEVIKVTVRKSALTAAVSTGNNILSGTIIGGGVIGLSAFLFGYWRFKRKKKGVAQQ